MGNIQRTTASCCIVNNTRGGLVTPTTATILYDPTIDRFGLRDPAFWFPFGGEARVSRCTIQGDERQFFVVFWNSDLYCTYRELALTYMGRALVFKVCLSEGVTYSPLTTLDQRCALYCVRRITDVTQLHRSIHGLPMVPETYDQESRSLSMRSMTGPGSVTTINPSEIMHEEHDACYTTPPRWETEQYPTTADYAPQASNGTEQWDNQQGDANASTSATQWASLEGQYIPTDLMQQWTTAGLVTPLFAGRNLQGSFTQGHTTSLFDSPVPSPLLPPCGEYALTDEYDGSRLSWATHDDDGTFSRDHTVPPAGPSIACA